MRTPSEVIDRLNKAVVASLKDPKVRQRLHELGAVVVGDTPQEFRQFLVEDMERWKRVVDEAGIKAS